MNIGIDIDNTITSTLPILKKYAKRYNKDVVKRNLKANKNGFSSYNLYDWTYEENLDFCIRYIEEIVLQAKIKDNAQKVIKTLKEEGNNIYIMTARRKPEYKKPKEITEKFLKENDIYYDELLIGQVNKKQFCIDYNIDLMIDDEPQNINSISEWIPVIAFDEVYNRECRGKNIFKVNSWNEIYSIIKEIERRL